MLQMVYLYYFDLKLRSLEIRVAGILIILKALTPLKIFVLFNIDIT